MFFWICGIVALGAILLAAGYLSYLNWSDEMWPRLISAFGVGLIAFLVAILTTLKGSEETSKFTTEALFDDSTGRPPVFSPVGDLSSIKRIQWLGDLNSIAGDSTIENENQKSEYLGELLQIKLLRELCDLQRTGTSLTRMIGSSEGQVQPGQTPVKLVDEVELKASDFEGYTSNRFSNSDSETFKWEKMGGLRVPKGAKVKLFAEELPQKYFIRIEKENFFVFEIRIEPIFGDIAGPPNGAEPVATKANSFSRWIFDVTMTSKFEKITSANWRTENYKKWVSWLMTELAARNREP